MIAETVLGRGDRAFDYYKKITPAYLEDKQRNSPHRALCLFADDRGQRRRQARRSEKLLADGHRSLELCSDCPLHARRARRVRRALIDPCIGKEIADFTISRTCRGTEFRIHVKNSGSGKKAKLKVGGKELSGNIVPYAAAGAIVEVECEV